MMPAKVDVPTGYQGTVRHIPRGRESNEERDFVPPGTGAPSEMSGLRSRITALEADVAQLKQQVQQLLTPPAK